MTDGNYTIKQYKRRWVNLFLFVIYAINNGVHWAQFTVINDSVAKYYNVSHAYVEWTTGIYYPSYVLFVAPGLYVMRKIKMKYIMILASSLSTLGAWIKVFSVEPDRFLLAFIGQIIMSASYSFIFGGSARLIASWFGVHESSRASALSLFGDQCGGALSFLLPVILVSSSDNSDSATWENRFRRMHIIYASISTLVLALIILLFKDKPKNPPSMVQALKRERESVNFAKHVPKMLKNRAFLMLLFWYSVVGTLLTTMGAVTGELISNNFPDFPKAAGAIGFIMIASGMFTSPIFGYIMDKTHRFKEVGIALATGCFISFSLFTLCLKMKNIIFVYITGTVLGTFMTSTYVNGIQIGIEILYPINEDQCSTMMVFIMHLFATIFLPVYSVLLQKCGDLAANLVFSILIFVGVVFSFLAPVKLNRQEAETNANVRELKEFLPKSVPQILEH